MQAEHASAQLIGIAGDVGSSEGTDAFCAAVDALKRPLDVLVNNVGIFAVKDFWDITDDDWQHTFDVNFFSNVRLCRHFLKPMLERNQVTSSFVQQSAKCDVKMRVVSGNSKVKLGWG